jgi:hypothetical protein
MVLAAARMGAAVHKIAAVHMVPAGLIPAHTVPTGLNAAHTDQAKVRHILLRVFLRTQKDQHVGHTHQGEDVAAACVVVHNLHRCTLAGKNSAQQTLCDPELEVMQRLHVETTADHSLRPATAVEVSRLVQELDPVLVLCEYQSLSTRTQPDRESNYPHRHGGFVCTDMWNHCTPPRCRLGTDLEHASFEFLLTERRRIRPSRASC